VKHAKAKEPHRSFLLIIHPAKGVKSQLAVAKPMMFVSGRQSYKMATAPIIQLEQSQLFHLIRMSSFISTKQLTWMTPVISSQD